jgi:protein phosphatase
MIVADGMGGHEGGEIASRMAVDCMRRSYYDSAAEPRRALTEALYQANREVLWYARRHPEFTGMGTTCTAVALVDGLVWLAHVGDTRLYIVRDAEALRMTEDHSVATDLVQRGLLSRAEADQHEDRNIILRAVGTRDNLEATTWKNPFHVQSGDRILICSDGLYETVPDEEICRICTAARSSQQACHALVYTAFERDGSDNITVAVLHVHGYGDPRV